MVRRYDGRDLAKVFIYHGIIEDTDRASMKVCCPFHGDVNPSMVVDFDKGEFFCFGCGVKGNALDFIQLAYPELNDIQACVLLEQILRSDEVRELNIKVKKRKKKQNKQALIEATDYYYGLNKTDWTHPKTKEEHAILEYMKGRGFDARALSVGRCKVNYSIAYPMIFPILDNGEFKGWVGRTMNKHVEKKRKYYYNEGFVKRTTLCGTYSENCIPYICEGYMDNLSIRTRGHIENVVSLLGWHISDEQVEKLKKQNITTVVSALDNDEYGIKGTEYLKKFFNVIRMPYPKGVKDPGDMATKQFRIAKQKVQRKLDIDKKTKGC